MATFHVITVDASNKVLNVGAFDESVWTRARAMRYTRGRGRRNPPAEGTQFLVRTALENGKPDFTDLTVVR